MSAQEAADLRQLRAEAERLRQVREIERRDRIWLLAERILQSTLVMLERAAAGATWSGSEIAKMTVVIEKLLRVACEPFSDTSATITPTRIAGAFKLFEHASMDYAELPADASEPEREAAGTGSAPLVVTASASDGMRQALPTTRGGARSGDSGFNILRETAVLT